MMCALLWVYRSPASQSELIIHSDVGIITFILMQRSGGKAPLIQQPQLCGPSSVPPWLCSPALCVLIISAGVSVIEGQFHRDQLIPCVSNTTTVALQMHSATNVIAVK